ncbi:glutamyl aminopeptidase [Leptinotarsa decemlineata]|uniref:glutamyl aminopeptidase n=1 Tax=Leptinotarsa decemlineata TaxID=7539 RepID=UPI003D307A17
MSKIVFLLGLVVTCSTGGYSSYRLSSEIIPNHYSIKIRPDFDNEIFFGEVRIYVRTKTDLQDIILHSSQLNITEVHINEIKAIFSLEQDDKLSVKYENETLQPGEHTVHISYSAPLIETTYGFIKASYEYYEEKMYLYVTEMEPTHARKVFPCFDEPSFKAKFNIRLISPNKTYKAISNMPEIATFIASNGVVYDFATSVKMSTYLVSFAFIEYPFYEEVIKENDRNVPVRIYTRNANEENNSFAANCTKRAITFYSEYTNISYPLPKLDMIEYNRTESAATENWGLITFREGLLTTTLNVYSKSQIKLVIYHELSHFWFGNFVTNDWWNDLWLQEGFATYMSYKLLAQDENQTQVEEMKSFQVDDFFEIEINFPTAPIVSYLASDKDISDKFNGVIYDKGAFLLLMLENVIGEEKFRLSIQKFLKKHAFGTATTNNFISVVEEMSPEVNVRSFMESYLYQSKFPIIIVTTLENGTYVLKQGVCKTIDSAKSKGGRWTIPVTYITDQNTQPKLVWFDKDMNELVIEETGAKWIIFNPKGVGMYKTVLEKNMWEKLAANFQEFDEAVSETLIEDAYYSYRFNMISCDVLFQLMQNVNINAIGKWLLFFPFYDHLKENLSCHQYAIETEMLLKFMRKRFDETHYRKNETLNYTTNCKEGDIMKEKDYLYNLNKCATWIRENLQTISTNVTVKP